MTAILGLADASYLTALREVRDVLDDLRDDQRALSEHVRVLMLGGWTGPAAEAYAGGWAEWEAGLRRVLEGLAEMAEAMSWVVARLHRCDDVQGSNLAGIDRRLGEPAWA